MKTIKLITLILLISSCARSLEEKEKLSKMNDTYCIIVQNIEIDKYNEYNKCLCYINIKDMSGFIRGANFTIKDSCYKYHVGDTLKFK